MRGKQRKIVTVFGGTGFVGRYVVKALAERGYTVHSVSRNPEEAGEERVCGQVGQVVLTRGDIRGEESIRRCLAGSEAVVNLVGILYETHRQKFAAIHAQGAERLARIAKQAGVKKLVHISALGVNQNAVSRYARTKLNGEKAVLAAFPEAVIMRPSIIFGAEDRFFNLFAGWVRALPVLPLIGGGKARFQPVYAGDVAKAVAAALENPESRGRIYGLGGPKIYTFRQLLQFICKQTGFRRRLAPVPFWLAHIQAAFLELLTPRILTRDQVRLLRVDNVVTEPHTIRDLGITPVAVEDIVPAYLKRYARR